MSLVPYNPPEGREIVLRHQNAIVVRDTSSHRLEIRSLSECPTCHQPLRPSSPSRSPPVRNDPNFVDPNYFRMLQHSDVPERQNPPPRPPPSPPAHPHHSRGRSNLHNNYEPSHGPLFRHARRLTSPALVAAESESESESEPEFASESGDEGGPEFMSSTPASTGEGSRIRREAFSPNYFHSFFVEEGELGRGGKGVVMLVRHEIDGCHLGHFACKRVPVGDNHAWLEKVLIEVELLAKLSHPNLVSYRHVWLEDVKLNRFGPRVACAFILQQYCNGGDLLHYIIGSQPKAETKEELKAKLRRRSRGQSEAPDDPLSSTLRRLTFEQIFSLFRDITSGLAYLHAANYIHRDLKPSNCLLHNEGGLLTCLISDFGEVQAENSVRRSTGTTGTISFCAPEVLRRDGSGRYGNFTTKSDIFSLGMILYFLCFGRLPYRGANMVHEELEDVDALRTEIAEWEGFHEERRIRPDLPLKLYHLLKKLLALNPTERPSAAEVLGAMNSEGNPDAIGVGIGIGIGIARSARSGSPVVGLQGRRIRDLDSPLPPAMPFDGDAVGTPRSGSKGRETNFTALDNLAAVESDESDLVAVRHPPDSPVRPARPSPTASSHLHVQNPQATLSPRLTTSLLMAPPTTRMGALQHHLRLRAFHVHRLLASHAGNLGLTIRLVIFLAKATSLSRPCWPYAVRVNIALPLLGLAGADLVLPGAVAAVCADEGAGAWARSQGRAWGLSAVLLLVHVLIVALVSRLGGLCAGGGENFNWDQW